MAETQAHVTPERTEDNSRIRSASPPYPREVSSRQIKEDIEQTRAEMDRTVNALGEQLHPRHLLDEVLDLFRSGSSPQANRRTIQNASTAVLRKIREHPVPTMLVGAGIAWMLLESEEEDETLYMAECEPIDELEFDIQPGGPYESQAMGLAGSGASGASAGRTRRRRFGFLRRARDRAARMRETAERARDTASDAAESLRQTADSVRERTSSAAGTVRDAASSAAAKLKSGAASARSAASATADALRTTASTTKHAASSAAEATRHAASSAAGAIRGAGSSAANTASRMGENVKSGTAAVKDQLSHAGHRAREGASMMSHRAREGYDYSRQEFSRLLDDYPLAMGAAALALGTIIGLTLPRSRREDELMGDAADDIKRRAKQSGKQMVGRGMKIAEVAADEAVTEAQRQGLTPAQLAEKAKRVASEASHAVSEKAHQEEVTPETLGEKVKEIAEHTKERVKDEIEHQRQDLEQEQQEGSLIT